MPYSAGTGPAVEYTAPEPTGMFQIDVDKKGPCHASRLVALAEEVPSTATASHPNRVAMATTVPRRTTFAGTLQISVAQMTACVEFYSLRKIPPVAHTSTIGADTDPAGLRRDFVATQQIGVE